MKPGKAPSAGALKQYTENIGSVFRRKELLQLNRNQNICTLHSKLLLSRIFSLAAQMKSKNKILHQNLEGIGIWSRVIANCFNM